MLTISSPISFGLFVTDAISEAAVSFYGKLGSTGISEQPSARMVLDLKQLTHREGRSAAEAPSQ